MSLYIKAVPLQKKIKHLLSKETRKHFFFAIMQMFFEIKFQTRMPKGGYTPRRLLHPCPTLDLAKLDLIYTKDSHIFSVLNSNF